MANDSDNSTILGRWADGDFMGTVSQHGGVGFDADLTDENRFVVGVVQLLRRRQAEMKARGESRDADIAIFVLQPTPPNSAPNAQRVPMVDNGLTMVAGRLWFTAAPVVSAHYVELPLANDDGRFSYVTDQLNLASQPTLIFDPRTALAQLRWYPKGLGQPNNVELKLLEGAVEPEDVLEAIDRLYNECFVTPSGLPQGINLWANASRHWPRKDAEVLIQSHLKAGLVSRFPFCKVRHEQSQPAGRSDLEIEQSDPLDHSHITRHAVIELKVLRSFWASGSIVSDTETKEWISEGVQQATAYCAEKDAQWSALCCFDMRKTDPGDGRCFAHVQTSADEQGVKLRRWFLYASPAEYRKATAP